MSLDLKVIQQFASTVTNANPPRQFPENAGTGAVFRRATVFRIDPTNRVAYVNIGGDTTEVPVAVTSNYYPIPGAQCVVAVQGNSYFMVGGPFGGGLLGDGFTATPTDESEKINISITALAASGGGIIELPAGNIGIGSPIVLESNIYLRGQGVGTRLVALPSCTDAVIVGDANAINMGASYMAIDGRYPYGGVCGGIHITSNLKTSPVGDPALDIHSGYTPPFSYWFHHLSIYYTHKDALWFDKGTVGVHCSDVDAFYTGSATAVSLRSNGDHHYYNNLLLNGGWGGSVWLENTLDIQIANSKFWNAGVHFDGSGNTIFPQGATGYDGVTIIGSKRASITGCATEYSGRYGLNINGSSNNKIDLVTEISYYADAYITGSSTDNNMNIRGRIGNGVSQPLAGVVLDGTGPVNNHIKYRRDAGYAAAGVPLYKLLNSASSNSNALNLSENDAGPYTVIPAAPLINLPLKPGDAAGTLGDLQLGNFFGIPLNAAYTTQINNIPAGIVSSGQIIKYILVQDSTGNNLVTWGSQFNDVPTLNNAAGAVTLVEWISTSTTDTPTFFLVTKRPYIQPAGLILPFGGSTAPPGTVLCNGQVLDRTVYSILFNVIGIAYGNGGGGPGAGFNVPNLTGALAVGAGTGTNGPAYTLGQTQVPGVTHNHTASGGGLINTTYESVEHNHMVSGITAGTTSENTNNNITSHTHDYNVRTDAQDAIPTTVVNWVITTGLPA